MDQLKKYLDESKTAYHAVDNAAAFLEKNGFTRLFEGKPWTLNSGDKCYVIRGGSALIAFTVGKQNGFNIVASHADSPCLKLKYAHEMKNGGFIKLNVEKYGGGILYSFLDTPLCVAGRVIVNDGNALVPKTFTSRSRVIIPSVAIHYNRNVNDGVKLDAQVDMCPLVSCTGVNGLTEELNAFSEGKIVDYDLFVTPAVAPFEVGYGEMLASPRIDNLTSVFASLTALTAASTKNTAVAFIADNEEVGSRTRQGAGSTFLKDVLRRITSATECDYYAALDESFMVSMDNAHSTHPNHPELSDPTNNVVMGGGLVIKHHANMNYTTDGVSSAIMSAICESAGVKCQHFFMRSDLACGGTLGAISSAQVSVKCVDAGLAQLAMHSATEIIAAADYLDAVKALKRLFACRIVTADNGFIIE